MKTLLLSLAALPLALLTFSPAAHADSFIATLNTGLVTDALVETPIAGGDQFTFTDETINALGLNGVVLNSSTSVFTATYVDLLGTVGVLNVNDVCVDVAILGPATPCQAFAFSFTDLTLGDASLVAAVDAVASVNANVASLDIAGGSVAGGSGSFNFTPPPSGSPAVTPEPNSLCLMATGMLAAAGAVRRKFAAAVA